MYTRTLDIIFYDLNLYVLHLYRTYLNEYDIVIWPNTTVFI